MPLSYRNIINKDEMLDTLGLSNYPTTIPTRQNTAKYIQGYIKESGIEALAGALGIDRSLFAQAFGLDKEKKTLDPYDPFNIAEPKKEEFWYYDSSGDTKKPGYTVQRETDFDVNTFKRSLRSEHNLGEDDFWFEDPFIPSFQLYFEEDSPLFNGTTDDINNINEKNCLKYFMKQYQIIDPTGYQNRFELWSEFKKVFFKIFEKTSNENNNNNTKNKAYYITKIEGLDLLTKKIINFTEDKIKITLNEDVSFIAWYLAELYNNIVYSYKNQRYMFPENLLRFNMIIKINDMRNFQIPVNDNPSSDTVPTNKNSLENKRIKNLISPKSEILYTLYDCSFNFFESKNTGNDLDIGGYNAPIPNSPQSLSFEIIFKSVNRISNFPLIKNSYSIDNINILGDTRGSLNDYYLNLDDIKRYKPTESKSYTDQLLGKAGQTVVNAGFNYLDNLETKLREIRGSAVNGLLTQFRNMTRIGRIQPDNVYNPDFNNRVSLKNFGKSVASGLLNELEDEAKQFMSF